MSTESPFSFHVVGDPGEPQHYELRDVAGRVVCKAIWEGPAGRLTAIRTANWVTICGNTDPRGVEDDMRAAVAR